MAEAASEAVVEAAEEEIVTQANGGSDVSPPLSSMEDVTEILLGLGEMLLDETGMDEAVTNILQVGASTLGPDTPAVSLTISTSRDGQRNWVTRDATTEWARELDEWQYEHGEGPCLSADENVETCVVDDCADDDRFPDFCQAALAMGVRSVVSYPMVVRGRSLGSINVFFAEAGTLTDERIAAGEQLARTAAPLLANWLAHQRVSRLAEQLQEALESRSTIERAKGLLMGELGVDEERAFEVLRTQSSHENTKLRVIAQRLLDSRRHS